jgi:PadR family transcriptional regulator, regulatory protein PadR
MGKEKKPEGELVQGTLDMLILSHLSRGPEHGFGIAEWVRRASDDVLRIEEGSLYPALQRLEAQGLITSEWGTSPNNRRARYYELTPRGRKQAGLEITNWRRLVRAIDRVIDPAVS